MKVLQNVPKEKSRAQIKAWEEKFKTSYRPVFKELLPTYTVLTDELEIQKRIDRQFNSKTSGFDDVPIDHVIGQAALNNMRAQGHKIEVLTLDDLNQIQIEKDEFENLVKNARIEGIGVGKELVNLEIEVDETQISLNVAQNNTDAAKVADPIVQADIDAFTIIETQCKASFDAAKVDLNDFKATNSID